MLGNYIQNLKDAELRSASRKGDTKAVKSLLALRADVDAVNRHGQTPLMLAFLQGHDDTVAALVAGGASYWDVEKGRAKYTSTSKRSKL